MPGFTYAGAGVDVDAGERLVDRIRSLADGTKQPWVLGSIGGFAGLSSLPEGLAQPVLVAGTDGVGTKLAVAFAANRHNTVGEDLVAMCVNDVITVGAKPLFFLDYFATGRLELEQGQAVIAGIASGCRKAQCALLGGETAEMPGMYRDGEYDLAGFCVGVVDRDKILDGSKVTAGDRIVAVRSHGLHSNGYSLARRVLLEHAQLSLSTPFAAIVKERAPEVELASGHGTLADELLKPTPIYQQLVSQLMTQCDVHALCHVTGGGIVGNLPRILPDGFGARLRRPRAPAIFGLIQQLGNVEEDEMFRAFNMGVGLLIACKPADVSAALRAIHDAGETGVDLGEVIEDTSQNVIFHEDSSA